MFVYALTLAAFANDGPQPVMFAEQAGADVILKLLMHERGEPGIGDAIDLLRDEEVAVVSDHSFAPEDAVGTGWYCGGGDGIMWGANGPIDCATEPELCEPCGESDTFCPIGGCFESYDIVVLDRCVPEGPHAWVIHTPTNDYVFSEVELDVAAADVPCEADEAACGCRSTSTTPGFALGALMLAIGFGARRRAR